MCVCACVFFFIKIYIYKYIYLSEPIKLNEKNKSIKQFQKNNIIY